MHPQHLAIKEFTYHLPDSQVALYPLEKRDDARLLIYKDTKISTSSYQHIAEHIPAESLLVFNNTKVIKARLFFQKASGALIEIFLLEPFSGRIQQVLCTIWNSYLEMFYRRCCKVEGGRTTTAFGKGNYPYTFKSK
jgi:S-adenosylmethionine:tRNA-ribosyltransferase-isomerase (queuine synthetase)